VTTEQNRPPISDGLPTQGPDTDPGETSEWLESLDGLLDGGGRTRARYVMQRLLEHARKRQIGVPASTSTDYVNTIPVEAEPHYPGDDRAPRAATRHRRGRPHLDLRLRG
jgi:pyruvate dehydrogenase E1 component